MRNRVRIALAVVLVAVVGVVGWQVLRQREPVYQGQRLSVWLTRYGDGDYTAVTQQIAKKEVDVAVRHMGTNAVPFLVRRIRAKDSAFGLWLVKMARLQHAIKVRHTPAYVRRLQALNGITALDLEARKTVVPGLIECLDDDDSQVRRYAGAALKAIDADAAAKEGVD